MRRENYEATDVRYNKDDEYLQSLLRVVLYEEWNSRCHWCGDGINNPAVAEIDHVVPASKYEEFMAAVAVANRSIYSPEFLESMQTMPDSPHDVSNLAPICARHNRTKSATISPDSLGPIFTSLQKSRVRSKRVVDRVMEMVNAKGLSASFVDLIGLRGDDETRTVVDKWGKAVTASLWKYDRKLLEDFRVPRHIDLDLEEGVIPDWFEQATKSGTGLDGRLNLTLDEHAALEGAIVLYEFSHFGTALSRAIKSVAEAVDGDVEQALRDQGVEHIEPTEPRWVSLSSNLVTGSEPRFDLVVTMSAGLGGETVLEDTDQDGLPMFAHRWRRFECVMICSTDFVSGEFEVTHDLTAVEDNFDEGWSLDYPQ